MPSLFFCQLFWDCHSNMYAWRHIVSAFITFDCWNLKKLAARGGHVLLLLLLQLIFYTIVCRLYRCFNLVITIIYVLISKLDFCFSRASSHVRLLSEYSTVFCDLLEFRHIYTFIGIENGHTYIYHLELFEVIIALAYA